ncbi:MAG: ABC transporter permease [Deltaproteobacteria bacterium]|nr:ABC transporter permease [Deltaproteobacteria bacterium]
MRRILLNLTMAMESLQNFKLRSALAIMGVFLGTVSLIVVSNLSSSLIKKTELEAAKLGQDLIIVRSGQVLKHATGIRLLSEATTLKPADAVALLAGSRFLKDVSPSSNKTFNLRSGQLILNSILVNGITPNFEAVRNFHAVQGRFIAEADDSNSRRVVLLGTKVVQKLFGDKDPFGKTILIQRVPFEVIGVMEEKGADLSGLDQDNQVFIPLNTFLKRLVNRDFISAVYVTAMGGQVIDAAAEEMKNILRKRHKIKPGQRDDFTIIDLKDVMALKAQAMNAVNVLGAIAATISFLIGSLGILSIMILMVSERRLEIGIRRAVGSKRRDIVFQFLMESSFISFAGAAVGVVAGVIISLSALTFFDLPVTISPAGFVFSFFASLAVGMTGGIYPAQKALTIQPVDVIRA